MSLSALAASSAPAASPSSAASSTSAASTASDVGLVSSYDEPRDASAVARAVLELSKPSITRMVLITTALGVLSAPQGFAWTDMFATVIGTGLVVAGANALNMFLERDSDRFMSRTKLRPLPTRRLTPDEALGFGVLVSVAGLFTLAQFVSMAAVGLAAFALLSYVLLYTPLKRVHSFALYVGAVPGALPPAIGYAALTGTLDGAGLSLFLILFAWQLPHFLAISIFRREEYARAGLRVLPNEKGVPFTKWVALAQSIFLLLVTLLPLRLPGIAPAYGWIAGAVGVIYVAWAASGLRESAGDKWARGFFFASLPYLVIVMTALAFSLD